jgi:anti-sigma B factor antagonist
MAKTIINIENVKDITIVRVKEKKIYQNVVHIFRERIMTVLEGERLKIVMDLSEVDVMNSSGLGVLIHMWDYLSQHEGKMVITGLSPIMGELFERMRLDALFNVARTEEEALQLIHQE